MTQTTTKPWYETLSPEKRAALFAWMRSTGDRALAIGKLALAHSAPYGTIPVGAAFFDYFVKGEGMEQYLMGLRRGGTPEDALARSLAWAQDAVKLHNGKRPKDLCWQRWIGHGSANLEALHRSCLAALE